MNDYSYGESIDLKATQEAYRLRKQKAKAELSYAKARKRRKK